MQPYITISNVSLISINY